MLRSDTRNEFPFLAVNKAEPKCIWIRPRNTAGEVRRISNQPPLPLQMSSTWSHFVRRMFLETRMETQFGYSDFRALVYLSGFLFY